jgi:phosphohistidine phosphatase
MADEARSLTPQGINKTQRVAQRLAELGLQFDVLLTSPLVRAWQTAEILQAAGLARQVKEFLPLSPAGKIGDWLSWLEDWQSTFVEGATAESFESLSEPMSLGLVGHEPNLSQWAQQLVGPLQGEQAGQQSDRWILKKAGIIGLALPKAGHAVGNSRLFWLAPPRFLL